MNFDISQIRWPDSYRNTNRRKEVLCTLCQKEMTKRDSGVCTYCTRAYYVGVAYQAYLDQLQSNNEQVVAKMPDYPTIQGSHSLKREEIEKLYYPDGLHFADRKLVESILALADITPTNRNIAELYILYPPTTYGNSDYRHDSYRIGTRRIFALLEKIFVLLRYAMSEEYKRGQRSGSDMLCKLAEGKITVDELNKYEANKRQE